MRDYPPEAVALVRFIRRAERLGFSLAEVAELLGLVQGGPADPEECRLATRACLLRVEAKLGAAGHLLDALRVESRSEAGDSENAF